MAPPKRSLYDILEVNRNEKPDAIAAAYKRRWQALQQAVGRNAADEDAANELKMLNEAYAIVSDRAQREAYDQRLLDAEQPRRAVEVADEPRSGNWMRWAVVAGAMLIAAYTYSSYRSTEVERLRLETERQKVAAEAEAVARRQQIQEAQLEAARERNETREEEQQRRELERFQESARRSAERNAAELRRDEERERREAERAKYAETRDQANQSRTEAYEEQRRLREAQARVERDKRLARELEYERTRSTPKAVAIPTN